MLKPGRQCPPCTLSLVRTRPHLLKWSPADTTKDLRHPYILTGGVNRHTGVLEAIEHRRILLEHGVPEAVMRYEDSSTTTRGNVELALPFLREALRSSLVLTAVCKWYHRRAIQLLRALVPEAPFFHAITWEPVYDGVTVTRSDWWL